MASALGVGRARTRRGGGGGQIHSSMHRHKDSASEVADGVSCAQALHRDGLWETGKDQKARKIKKKRLGNGL